MIYLLGHLKNSSHQVRYLLTNVHLNEKPAVETEDKAILYLLQVVVIDQQAHLWFILQSARLHTLEFQLLFGWWDRERTHFHLWRVDHRLANMEHVREVFTDWGQMFHYGQWSPEVTAAKSWGCAYSHMSCSDPEVKEIVSYSFLFIVVGSYVDCVVSNWDEKTNCRRKYNTLF